MIEPRREILFGWGGASHARSLVYRPRAVAETREAVTDARRRGLTIVHRGAGQSYGDAALNQGGATLAMEGLDQILAYDPEAGVVRAEAGVTLDVLWRHVIADGWWPPVVPGTSQPTLGGCLAMNVHGKNHIQVGSFAEHVRSLTVLEPDGGIRTHAAGEVGFERHVGAQGLRGTLLALELELDSVESGYLEVVARSVRDLTEAMDRLRELETTHDYTVAWIDAFARAPALGRGEVHAASYLPAGHEAGGEGLSVEAQVPGGRILGLIPRNRVGSLLRGVVHDPGMRSLNLTKYVHARLKHPSHYLQPHASFHFLLDSIPDWKRGYGPGGLLQYQFFVPEPAAAEVFRQALRLQHAHGLVSYLAVLKRHRKDPFPTNYSVDGFSLALDFPVRERSLPDLMALMEEFEALRQDAGGRLYAAKDAVSRRGGKPPEPRAEFYDSNLVRRWSR